MGSSLSGDPIKKLENAAFEEELKLQNMRARLVEGPLPYRRFEKFDAKL